MSIERKAREGRIINTGRYTALVVACLSTAISFCCAQNTAGVDSAAHLERSRNVQVQVSVGVASTNFSYPVPGYGNQYLSFLHADLFFIRSIGTRSDVRLGIAYEPVGYQNESHLANGESIYTKHRLFYGNVHALYGYRLSRPENRFAVSVLAGGFVGRLANDDIVSLVQPDNAIYRGKSVSTYDSWNAGISLGFSGTLPLFHRNVLGVKVVYHPGLTNIVTEEATRRSGMKRYTRSIALSTTFNF